MEARPEKVFPLKKAYPFAEQNGLSAEAQRIRDMEITWDRPYTSSVRRGFMIEVLQDRNLLAAFESAHWPYGSTSRGDTEKQRCLTIKAEFVALKGGSSSNPPGEADVNDGEETSEFALEAHLRDFLAKHPDRLEPGLRLYSTAEVEGVEYPVDDGRIDILGVDAKGRFVVVELKLSRGRNRALGQLLYYMGWIDKNLGKGPCRGVIVAKEITADLVTAVSRVPDVSLFRYRMSFSVEEVTSSS